MREVKRSKAEGFPLYPADVGNLPDNGGNSHTDAASQNYSHRWNEDFGTCHLCTHNSCDDKAGDSKDDDA